MRLLKISASLEFSTRTPSPPPVITQLRTVTSLESLRTWMPAPLLPGRG
jgi:hypothetical protein